MMTLLLLLMLLCSLLYALFDVMSVVPIACCTYYLTLIAAATDTSAFDNACVAAIIAL